MNKRKKEKKQFLVINSSHVELYLCVVYLFGYTAKKFANGTG